VYHITETKFNKFDQNMCNLQERCYGHLIPYFIIRDSVNESCLMMKVRKAGMDTSPPLEQEPRFTRSILVGPPIDDGFGKWTW
jgi:hypothetical protein